MMTSLLEMIAQIGYLRSIQRITVNLSFSHDLEILGASSSGKGRPVETHEASVLSRGLQLNSLQNELVVGRKFSLQGKKETSSIHRCQS